MIKLTILYPNTEGKKFDKYYYLKTHIPMSLTLQGEAVRHVSIEFGISGGLAGSQPPYVAICTFLYDSMEAFQKAFMPHAKRLREDIVHYTDIETIIQFSEVSLDIPPNR